MADHFRTLDHKQVSMNNHVAFGTCTNIRISNTDSLKLEHLLDPESIGRLADIHRLLEFQDVNKLEIASRRRNIPKLG